MNGGGDINSLGLLPDKLKTELALHVNLETLKKVIKLLCLFMMMMLEEMLFSQWLNVCRDSFLKTQWILQSDLLLNTVCAKQNVVFHYTFYLFASNQCSK